MNCRDVDLTIRVELWDAPDFTINLDAEIAQIAQWRYHSLGNIEAPPIGAISIRRIARKGGLVAGIGNETLARYQPGDDANGESAAAETEAINAVTGSIIAAAEAVDVDDIALQSEAENPSKRSKYLEGRSADAVVIKRDLARWIAQIQDLKKPPDIGLEKLG